MMRWYARVLAHHPHVVLVIILVIAVSCLAVNIIAGPGLRFDDPIAGFEPRGTELSNRLITLDNLLDNSELNANRLPFLPSPVRRTGIGHDRITLSTDPAPSSAVLPRPSPGNAATRDESNNDHQRNASLNTHGGIDERVRPVTGMEKQGQSRAERGGKRRGKNRKSGTTSGLKSSRRKRSRSVDGSLQLLAATGGDDVQMETGNSTRKRRVLAPFCTDSLKWNSRLVVKSSRSQSLFNRNDLVAICQLDRRLFRSWPFYSDFCEHDTKAGRHCCPAWSIGRYVALIAGRARCKEITPADVVKVHGLLTDCAPLYHNGSLLPRCSKSDGNCPGVNPRCMEHGDAVYNILHFLTDDGFMKAHRSSVGHHALSQGRSESYLRYANIILPVSALYSSNVEVFDKVNSFPRTMRGLEVVGAHFGENTKFTLLERHLLGDTVWLGLACGVIFLGMWLYTSSLFVTAMAFLAIFWAVQLAYFLYTFVFRIHFFPYMNTVTLVLMVGVGADDLFIYCRIWRLAKAEKNNGVLEKIIADTLRHTALSMLVTSFTTAATFYANSLSDITSIRCFAIFAGTCIVINFLLTLTWLPASVMLHERWLRGCVGGACNGLSMNQSLSNNNRTKTAAAVVSSCCACVSTLPHKIYFLMCNWSRIFFEKFLPYLVVRLRFVWLIVFSGVSIASLVVVFVYPKLKLPSSKKFQVFSSDHLLERYDFELSDSFNFEKHQDELFPVYVVWGVLAADTGDHFDPEDKGSLVFDPEFDMTTQDAQRWILNFCARIRSTDFYKTTWGLALTGCFMENFVYNWMTRPCTPLNTQCCNQTQFPYQKAVMMHCLSEYIGYMQVSGIGRSTAGPRFHNGRISAFFVHFQSNISMSFSYVDAKRFYTKVNSWVSHEMQTAPLEMRRGWFISHFDFFALQSSLVTGTPLALAVSLAVVAPMAFFTTLNVLVSIYALLAVGGAISVTLGSLVLLGWTLDLLESIVITVALGLAVDLTLHYGVAYRLAPHTGSEHRVVYSIARTGVPVSMAATTTIIAGAVILPSTVLVYRKFGIFLVLLVSLAWLYATFFFQSLLRIAGPNAGFGQFEWPAVDCCVSRGSSCSRADKTIYSMSESTLSSSSTSTREHSSHGHSYVYTQELEPLTNNHYNGRTFCERNNSYHKHRHNCHRNHHRHQDSQDENHRRFSLPATSRANAKNCHCSGRTNTPEQDTCTLSNDSNASQQYSNTQHSKHSNRRHSSHCHRHKTSIENIQPRHSHNSQQHKQHQSISTPQSTEFTALTNATGEAVFMEESDIINKANYSVQAVNNAEAMPTMFNTWSPASNSSLRVYNTLQPPNQSISPSAPSSSSPSLFSSSTPTAKNDLTLPVQPLLTVL